VSTVPPTDAFHQEASRPPACNEQAQPAVSERSRRGFDHLRAVRGARQISRVASSYSVAEVQALWEVASSLRQKPLRPVDAHLLTGKPWDKLSEKAQSAVKRKRAKGRASHPAVTELREFLFALRQEAGLSQTFFALRLGVGKRTVQVWENSYGHVPSLSNLPAIFKLLEELRALRVTGDSKDGSL
jgi:DNA-binding transcriptional regulator YiaG